LIRYVLLAYVLYRFKFSTIAVAFEINIYLSSMVNFTAMRTAV